jgi:hypothetical protein
MKLFKIFYLNLLILLCGAPCNVFSEIGILIIVANHGKK